MNELNPLEKHLRSWTPRPPSAALKTRLFGTTHPPVRTSAGAESNFPSPWQWLAPTMALFVVSMSIVGLPSATLTELIKAPVDDSAPLQPHQSQLAAYYAPSVQSGHNAWRVATFDWTNPQRGLAGSSATWEASETNILMR
jgi:hypothetical protein